ncbi:MAG: LysM peptidoglycan-binding domain-containing protein [Pseudomonadota bacterium]
MIFKSAAASQTAGVFGFVLVAAAAVGLPQTDAAKRWLDAGKSNLTLGINQLTGATADQLVASLPAGDEAVVPDGYTEVAPVDAAQPSEPITGPVIDLLRVEPDGNTLVSGSAEAGAQVMLKSGDETIGETVADASGNFVILPNDFLPKGDHQLRVTSISPADDEIAEDQITGDQIADDQVSNDQIAAQGADMAGDETKNAGELVAQPKEVQGTQTAVIAIPEKGKESELLAVLTTNDGPSLILEKPEREPVTEELVTEDPETEDSATVPVGPVTADQGKDSAEKEPADLTENAAQTAEQTNRGTIEQTSDQTEIAALEFPAAAPEQKGQAEIEARAETSSAPIAPETVPAVPTTIARIEAIETEDKRMFVAGAASKGAKLRLYLDNRFLGATTGGDGDRFLFERSISIDPGQYQLRIDQLGPGGQVVSRAQVPFVREDDQELQASLVAPATPAAGENPPVEVAAKETALAPTQALPVDEAKSQANAPGAPAQPDVQGPDGLETVGDLEVAAVNEDASPNAVPTTTFEVTETKDQSVIIRRGDTLWRISRRVYGQGIRYTTIYLANKDQIRDPDRIFPGQIFGLPEDDANGAAANELQTDDS